MTLHFNRTKSLKLNSRCILFVANLTKLKLCKQKLLKEKKNLKYFISLPIFLFHMHKINLAFRRNKVYYYILWFYNLYISMYKLLFRKKRRKSVKVLRHVCSVSKLFFLKKCYTFINLAFRIWSVSQMLFNQFLP